jgi:hypothetical protein
MDRLEIVVAEDELGLGVQDCAEPIINGESLVDILKRAEREPIGYAGLSPHALVRTLRQPEGVATLLVLGCICGCDGCSWVRVRVETGPDEVVWHAVGTSGADASVYAAVGPYRFSRAEYERALAAPRRAEAPVRDRSALARLARGLPADHREWLQDLYVETQGDPFDDENMPMALAGLRVFAASGDPISDHTATAWARDVYQDFPAGLVVGVIRTARAVAEIENRRGDG